MQKANGIVILCPENKQHVRGITPAEALIIYKLHFKNSNGSPLEGFVIDGEAVDNGKPRSNAEECARLKRKYTGLVEGKRAFEAVFGTGTIVQLPKTFGEIAETIGPVFSDAPAEDAPEPEAAEVHTHEWNNDLENELTNLLTSHKPTKDQKVRLKELQEYKATAVNVRR